MKLSLIILVAGLLALTHAFPKPEEHPLELAASHQSTGVPSTLEGENLQIEDDDDSSNPLARDKRHRYGGHRHRPYYGGGYGHGGRPHYGGYGGYYGRPHYGGYGGYYGRPHYGSYGGYGLGGFGGGIYFG